MKIEFDKALLWLIPYLYLVSIMYYWSYWGAFDIDALNYYDITDLVKGVTAPLNRTLAACVAAAVYCIILFKLYKYSLRLKRKIRAICYITWLSVSFILNIFDNYFSTNNSIIRKLLIKELESLTSIIIFASIILTAIIKVAYFKTTPIKAIILNPIRTSGVFFLIITPLLSYMTGKQRSFLISRNIKFEYITNSSLTNEHYKFYKYLGKTGEYYIFSTLDNNKHIITPISEFKQLTLESYSLDDKKSINRFRKHLEGK